jgi:hypothetical protein
LLKETQFKKEENHGRNRKTGSLMKKKIYLRQLENNNYDDDER